FAMVVPPKADPWSTVQSECEVHPSIVIKIQNRNPSCTLWRMFWKYVGYLEGSFSWIFEDSSAPFSTGENNIDSPIIVVVGSDRGQTCGIAIEARLRYSCKRSVPIVAPNFILTSR